MTERVKCNKATRKCRQNTSSLGSCPHAIFHNPEENYKGELCTGGDFCSTPYGNDVFETIRMRCMTKKELKNWQTKLQKIREEIDKICREYNITLEELL